MFKKSLKKFVVGSLIIAMASISTGCGDTKKIDGITYDTYGILNKGENRNTEIKYRIVIGNIVWSVILVSTIVAPIYFLGFSMYEPTRKINENDVKGSV